MDGHLGMTLHLTCYVYFGMRYIENMHGMHTSGNQEKQYERYICFIKESNNGSHTNYDRFFMFSYARDCPR